MSKAEIHTEKGVMKVEFKVDAQMALVLEVLGTRSNVNWMEATNTTTVAFCQWHMLEEIQVVLNFSFVTAGHRLHIWTGTILALAR